MADSSLHIKASPVRRSAFWLVVCLAAAASALAMNQLMPGLPASQPWLVVFKWAALLCYAMLYFVPALFIVLLLSLLPGKHRGGARAQRMRLHIGVLLISLTLLLIYADLGIYRLYGFHINGFVLNIVFTPGGLESLGVNLSALLTLIGASLALWCGLALVFELASRWLPQRGSAIGGFFRGRYIASLLVLLLASQAAMYGYYNYRGNTAINPVVAVIPGFQSITYRDVLRNIGIQEATSSPLPKGSTLRQLHYPLHPLEVQMPAQPYNILWLTVESLRADMLTPRIMPYTERFAESALRFDQHYSGANGTRMGMFSQFYGLYGSYWFDFLNARRPPVLFDVLQQEDYQISLYTSAKFSYPEFDKTVFSSVPAAQRHEYDKGYGWERDRYNVGQLLEFMRQRDKSRPFMGFMFFESPHARYYFPPDAVIEPDYLEDFNYLTADIERDIDKIRNRYINSVHYLDTQLERIFAFLQQEGLLDSTIVIVTGDHGEAFMEKGRWGHNSDFTQEQIRVPLVMSIPHSAAQRIARMTSHVDIIPTIMPLLGVTNPVADYSLGTALTGTDSAAFMVLSDWDSSTIVTPEFKQSLAVRMQGVLKGTAITDINDRPIEGFERDEEYRHLLTQALYNSYRFVQPNSISEPEVETPQHSLAEVNQNNTDDG